MAGSVALAGAGGAPAALAAGDSAPQGEQVYVGRCSFPGCFCCEREVIVRDGRIVHTRPRKEAPYGRRPCPKGLGLVPRLYAEERVKYPMKRVEGTARGTNNFERISWEEAIELITTKWKALRDQYGPQCMMFQSADGKDVSTFGGAMRLSALTQCTSIDQSADWAFYAGVWRAMCPDGKMTNPGNEPFEEDVFNAKRVINWGNNLTDSYPQRWRTLCDFQDKGGHITVIDPNETRCAHKADSWLRIRPGADAALALAMSQVVVEEGLQDVEFLTNQTVAPFLVRKDNGMFLRMSDLGVAPLESTNAYGMPILIDPEVAWDLSVGAAIKASEAVEPTITGSFVVEGIEVTTAYDLLVQRLQDYTPEKVADIVDLPAETIRELALLSVDGPVTHLVGMGMQAYDNGLMFGVAFCTLLAITGQVNKPGAGCASMNASPNLNFMMMAPTGTFTSGTISTHHLPEVMKTGKLNGVDWPIKAGIFFGKTFLGGRVDMNGARRDILDKLELIVTIEMAMSDTALYSDIVLPSAHTYEHEVINYCMLERELPYSPKMAEPLYEAKSDFEIASLLIAGMGYGEHVIESETEANRQAIAAEPLASWGITIEKLREQHTMRFAEKGPLIPQWLTPSGRVEFYAEAPTVRMDFGQERNVEAERLPEFRKPYEAWPDTQAIKKYPLIVGSMRSRFRFHSAGWEGQWFNEIEPWAVIHINPGDADARGIKDGDWVEVYNDRGHAVVKACVDAGTRPGVAWYPKGLMNRHYKAGNFAEISHAHYDPFAVNSSLWDTAAEIRLWEGDE